MHIFRLFFVTAALITASPAVKACDEEFFAAQVENRYAIPFRNGDVESWADAFTEDAVAMHNRRPPDEGRAAIRAFGEMVVNTFEFKKYELRVDAVRCEGNWVYTRGTYRSHLVFRENGQDAPWGPEWGKFLLLWEHQADGEWKIVLDMGNSNGEEVLP